MNYSLGNYYGVDWVDEATINNRSAEDAAKSAAVYAATLRANAAIQDINAEVGAVQTIIKNKATKPAERKRLNIVLADLRVERNRIYREALEA